MKIQILTSIFGISEAAFYGNAYSNHYNQYVPRPGAFNGVPSGYMPGHPHRPGPGMVQSKVPAVSKKQVHQGALCGKITDFR